MSELKTRYYVTPSSIGSYFGVGFNTPEEQFMIDSGQVATSFDDASVERMEWGKFLEDGALDFFASKFDMMITDRNSEFKMGYDGKIKYIVDGMAIYNGESIVVENKISNSTMGRFTENMGYIMQCQLYMYLENVNKALLCGIYQGKPIYEFIDRDDEMIKDILAMADYIVDCLMGFASIKDYPVDLLGKYGSTDSVVEMTDLSEKTLEYFTVVADLEEKIKEIEKVLTAVKAEYAPMISEDLSKVGKFENDVIKVTASKVTRAGAFDVDSFRLAHPEIDTSAFYRPSTSYITRRVVKK